MKQYLSTRINLRQGEKPEIASRRLLERDDRTAQKAAGTADEQIDAAIDEAADYVRHHSE
jgi:hypothetical protein